MPLAARQQLSSGSPDRSLLRAGRVTAELDPSGVSLRDIALCGEVVLPGLGFVARDPDWGTLALTGEPALAETGDGTTVECRGEGAHPSGDLSWEVRFRVAPDAVEAHCTVRSRAGFRTNRTGLVILHALGACRGQDATIISPEGATVRSRFPDLVSPHQPFRNVATLEHRTSGGAAVRIALEGEVFETEDQRNWTDASYKTYSRPLDKPFPYDIRPGEPVSQSVRVSLSPQPATGVGAVRRVRNPQVRVTAPLPRIGIGLPAWRPVANAAVREGLRRLGPAFVAVEIDPTLDGWDRQLSAQLSVFPGPVRLDCRLGGVADGGEFLRLLRKVLGGREPAALSVWDAAADAVEAARKSFPGVPLGGGTGAFFAELNRGALASGVDYATWSSNPTVHACDDDTLGEAVEPLPDIVATARRRAPGLGLAVGPLTLRMRFNPNATSAAARRAEPPADPRQGAVIAAAWLLGTVAGLLDPAVGALTAFEVSGPKGVLNEDGSPSPAGRLIARLAPLGGCPAEALIWPHEPRARGLLIATPTGARLLAVTQARAEPAWLGLPPGRWRSLEGLAPGGFAARPRREDAVVEVEGFGVVWLAEPETQPG